MACINWLSTTENLWGRLRLVLVWLQFGYGVQHWASLEKNKTIRAATMQNHRDIQRFPCVRLWPSATHNSDAYPAYWAAPQSRLFSQRLSSIRQSFALPVLKVEACFVCDSTHPVPCCHLLHLFYDVLRDPSLSACGCLHGRRDRRVWSTYLILTKILNLAPCMNTQKNKWRYFVQKKISLPQKNSQSRLGSLARWVACRKLETSIAVKQ